MCQTKMDQKRVKTSHPTGALRIHGQLKPLEREKKCKHELFRLVLCRENAHEVTEDVEGCGETLLFPKAFLN